MEAIFAITRIIPDAAACLDHMRERLFRRAAPDGRA